MLKGVWGAAGYPWSVRLKALIPLWMPWVREHFHLRPEVERQLLAISARQIDRRLRPYKSLRPATPVRRHPTGSPAEASHPPEGGSLGCPRSRLHGSGSGGAVGQIGGRRIRLHLECHRCLQRLDRIPSGGGARKQTPPLPRVQPGVQLRQQEWLKCSRQPAAALAPHYNDSDGS